MDLRSQHTDSWYAASANCQFEEPPLQGAAQTDVCVIGAGITGLSAALNLAEAGFRVIVLEAARVGWGASGRSGGQFIFGFGCEQEKIESLVGREDAVKIWEAGCYGVELLRERIVRHRIQCDLCDGHAHLAVKPRQVEELRRWHDDLRDSYGYPSLRLWDRERTREEVASERYLGALYDSNSGHLHPLNYTLGLALAAREAGAVIHEDSAVVAIKRRGDGVAVETAQGSVAARFLVLAGNAYLNQVMPKIESKVMPVGTYIGASAALGEQACRELIKNNIAAADINFVLDYFRCSADHRLLFGGRVSYSTRAPRNLKASMQRRMLAVFPQLRGVEIEYAWGGFVAITLNRAPHLGSIGGNILFAHGYSGHGMAAAGLAGKLMADAVAGQAGQLDIFSRIPHLPFPGGRMLRTPALVLAMLWYRLRDSLG